MWAVYLDPSWCVTTGKLFYPVNVSLLGSPLLLLESLPLHFVSTKHSAPFITLKNARRGTQFASQVDDRHTCGYQGRDF